MSGDHERAGFEALAASGADDQAARSLAAKLKAAPDAPALKSLAALWLHCAVAQGAPKRFDVEALRRYPQGSLAASFVAMLDAEGFDPEPLSREDLGIAKLPPPLDYLNARILQCHDLWHLVAGYRTTALHEVAISGFQLAQFGHHYSAMFLGMVLTRVAFEAPQGGPILLETILTAWSHGRKSPPLLPVKWESLWDKGLSDVRARLKIAPYVSPFPSDLFEQLNIPADVA